MIILPNTSPRFHQYGAVTLAAVETVLGVVDVKTNLNKDELEKVLSHCKKVNHLKRQRRLEIKFLDITRNFTGVPYIVFSYGGMKYETTIKHIKSLQKELGLDLVQMPDLIVVLKRDYALWKNAGSETTGVTVSEAYRTIWLFISLQ